MLFTPIEGIVAFWDGKTPREILKAFDGLWVDIKERNANREMPEWDRMPIFLMDKGALMSRILATVDIVTLDELVKVSASQLHSILSDYLQTDQAMPLVQLTREAEQLNASDPKFLSWLQAVQVYDSS